MEDHPVQQPSKAADDASQDAEEGHCSQSVDNMTTIEQRAPPRIFTALEAKSKSIQYETDAHTEARDPKARAGPITTRPLKGAQLRSVDRLNQIHAERKMKNEEVNVYRHKSKDWYQRKDRQPLNEDGDIVHKDIAQKYKDAFKNLSQELKKKITDVGSKRMDAEEAVQEAHLQPSESVESLEHAQGNDQHNDLQVDHELSQKYLQAAPSGRYDQQPFQSNVSNESFGPAKSSRTASIKPDNMKHLGHLMKALHLDESKQTFKTTFSQNGARK